MKNKVAAPFREAEFDILYGKGISKEGDLLDLAVAKNIVEKSGAWYSYNNERIGQGRENARRFLIENPQVAAKLEERLRKEIGLSAPGQPVPVVATPADEEEDSNGSAKTRSGPREMKVAGGRRTEARS